MRLYILSFIFFCFSLLSTQQALSCDSLQWQLLFDETSRLESSGEFERADSIIKIALELCEEYFVSNSEHELKTMITAFRLGYRLDDVEQLLQRMNLYISIIKSHDNVNHAAIAEMQMRMGLLYSRANQIDSLVAYLRRAEIEVEKISGPHVLHITLAYQKGRMAYMQDDLEASLTYLQNGLQYLNLHFKNDINSKLLLLNGIGIGYRRHKSFEKAVQSFTEALQIIEQNPAFVSRTGNLLNNLGLAYMNLEYYPDAIRSILKSRDFYIIHFGSDHFEIGTAYDNIGLCYERAEKLDSAMFYYSMSEEIHQVSHRRGSFRFIESLRLYHTSIPSSWRSD